MTANQQLAKQLRAQADDHMRDRKVLLVTAVALAETNTAAAARKNVRSAAKAAKSKKTIAEMPKEKRTALGKQGAAVAKRKRTGDSEPKTRQELYREAQRRGLPGRSKMGRDELARALKED